jgi:hypothetical protein
MGRNLGDSLKTLLIVTMMIRALVVLMAKLLDGA